MGISDIVLQPEETVDAKWASEEVILHMIENGEFVASLYVPKSFDDKSYQCERGI